MSDPPPDGFEWLDDPVTIAVEDYVPRIAAAVYPDHPPSKAKSKVWLAIRDGQAAKKNPLHLMPAPQPFPAGHVFAEEFFRWVARRWPGRIPWLHPRAENELLRAENKNLAERLARAKLAAEALRKRIEKSSKIKKKIADPNHRGGRGKPI